MEIEQSSLYRQIQAITRSGAKEVHYHWVAQIHANGKTYDALKLTDLDIRRDYEHQYGDEVQATLTFPLGTFYSRIYPYMDNLECTLFKLPLLESGNSADTSQAVQSERYACVLHDVPGSPGITSDAPNNADEQALNLTELFTVQVELLNKSIQQLRMMSFGGVFRQCTTEKALRAIMTVESQKLVIDQSRQNKGVEMVPANNTTVRDHIEIPQGTPLIDVPSYIHERCGGVYSAGFGYYLQNDHWYVYPLYDPTRFLTARQALTIVNVPKNKFPSVERTFMIDGNNVILMATGDVKFKDKSNEDHLNRGNGVRFADASKLMDGFTKTQDNITLAGRGGSNTEVISAPRADGLNNVKQSDTPIHANPYKEYSKLAQRDGAYLLMTWENSDPSYITPGVMCQILYLDGDDVNTIYGTVLHAHSKVRMSGSGMTNGRHITDTGMVIFVKRPVGNGVQADTGVINPYS
jgi:hypothetical protein